MKFRSKEKSAMPNKDPNSWQWLLDYLPIAFVSILTFAMGFIRGVHEGGSLKKSLLGAVMCTLLATPLFPVFLWVAESQGWPPIIALPPCVFLAFLGTDWIRSKADELYDVFITFVRKWLK
ncbi:phage holin family protein [Vreelandella glaciei]|uniref:phage holin family protein n=1 Tax=Vreelandella glaciei TaxID=186761 RepID=UPI003002CD59